MTAVAMQRKDWSNFSTIADAALAAGRRVFAGRDCQNAGSDGHAAQ